MVLIILSVSGGVFGFIGIKSFFTVDEVKPQPELPKPVELPKTQTPASRATASVYKEVVSEPTQPQPSSLWRVAGYVRAPAKRSFVTSEMLGVPHVDLTERVALVNGSRYRYVSMSQCEFFEGGIDIYCDIDGERITPWTGSGAVTTVYQPNYNVAPQPPKPVNEPVQQTRVTVIPHTPRERSFPVN